MSASQQPDPVELVAGSELEPRTYRCPQCRTIDLYPDRLPTGGTACLHCDAKISPSDVLVYARVRVRLLALLVDLTGVFVTTGGVLLFVGWIATSVAPRDVAGDIVPEAVLWITVVELAIALVMALSYLVAGNARGASVAKRALGLAVVDATTGDVLDSSQQSAFERFIRGGGGFVGVHSASDTEYDHATPAPRATTQTKMPTARIERPSALPLAGMRHHSPIVIGCDCEPPGARTHRRCRPRAL